MLTPGSKHFSYAECYKVKTHIKVAWETHQIKMKYRDKLLFQWRAPHFS